MQEIAAASAEQSESVVQIGSAMGQLNRATQQNASAAEELAATSDELSGQAEQLQQSIAYFTMKGGATGTPVGTRNLNVPERRVAALPSRSLDKSDVLTNVTPGSVVSKPAEAVTSGLDYESVIAAHAKWKTRFRSAINRQEAIDAVDIGRDDRCELGRWIYTSGKGIFAHQPMFQRLIQEHKHFHQCAGEVAHAINHKRFDAAVRMIDHQSKFMQASNSVVGTLGRMRRELG